MTLHQRLGKGWGILWRELLAGEWPLTCGFQTCGFQLWINARGSKPPVCVICESSHRKLIQALPREERIEQCASVPSQAWTQCWEVKGHGRHPSYFRGHSEQHLCFSGAAKPNRHRSHPSDLFTVILCRKVAGGGQNRFIQTITLTSKGITVYYQRLQSRNHKVM